MKVPFLDLQSQHRRLEAEILDAWSAILRSARFIAGQEVENFEREWAEAVGAAHCVAVSSGTDALSLALRAAGVTDGNRVVVPANTFIATAEAVSHVGGVPLLVDVDERTANLRTDALDVPEDVWGAVPVHLYGQPVDVDALGRTGARLVFDAAQAHLARVRGKPIGGAGLATCYSFYPGKNLGAPCDAGAVTTDDAALADELRMLRDHGQEAKYISREIGYNARMSELAAAALRIKLPHLAEWTARRRAAAARYQANLRSVPGIGVLKEPGWAEGVYHLFVVNVPGRDEIQAALDRRGIGTGLHYPVAVHQQPAYRFLGLGPGSFPVSEQRAERLLSLPMYPEIEDVQIDAVCDALISTVETHVGVG